MSAVVGGALGLVAGSGLALVAARVPAARAPRLDDRLGPYLRDAPQQSRLLVDSRALTPFPTLERLLRPALHDAMRFLERWVGGVAAVRRRLDTLGNGMTVEQFRAEQVVWGAVGLAVALGLGLVGLLVAGRAEPVAVLGTAVVLTLGGVLARDWLLSRQVAAREARMLEEFPTIAELLALAVSAGEGPVGALERVHRISTGELSRELGRALTAARAGATLVQALSDVAARTSLAPLARFVDGVSIAVERGTPLADVLRAQAVDVRESGKRALLDAAGRKEILMMVPVVFLVLPVTVLFALFPGFYGLTLLAG